MKHWRTLVAVLAVLALALVGGWIGLQAFASSPLCRDWISKRIGRSLHATGSLTDFSWNKTNFYSSHYQAVGNPGSRLISLDARNLSAHLVFPKLFAGIWEFDEFTVGQADLRLGKQPSVNQQPNPVTGLSLNWLHGPSFRFEIEHILLNEINVSWQTDSTQGSITGTRADARRKDNKAWDIALQGGRVAIADLPKFTVVSAQGMAEPKQIRINSAQLQFEPSGTLNLDGTVQLDDQDTAELHGRFADLDAGKFIPANWHLTAAASGEINYDGGLHRLADGRLTGKVHLDRARIDWGYFLGKLRSFIKASGIEEWAFTSVDADVTYQKDHVEVQNLVAKYEDQAVVRGNVTVINGQVNGTLSVGLSADLLNWLPGLQQKVFTEVHDGLCWTEVHLSGDENSPKEDLSKRVVSALQEAFTHNFKDQAKDALKSFLDLFR